MPKCTKTGQVRISDIFCNFFLLKIKGACKYAESCLVLETGIAATIRPSSIQVLEARWYEIFRSKIDPHVTWFELCFWGRFYKMIFRHKKYTYILLLKSLSNSTVECQNPNVRNRNNAENRTFAGSDFRQKILSEIRTKSFGFWTLH